MLIKKIFMLPIVTILLMICILLAIFQSINKEIRGEVLILLGITLILVTIFRPSEMRDYMTYSNFFANPDFLGGERFEIGFVLLSRLLRNISSNLLVFLGFFALISILLKLLAIKMMSPFFWGSMALYVGGMFILHDMIQMRCAIASGILLWAVKFAHESNLKGFALCCCIAILFHYSATIIIPLWFLRATRINKYTYACIIPISYIVSLLGITLSQYLTMIDVPVVQVLINMYIDDDETSNIFNALQLLRCALAYLMLWKIECISKHYPISVYLCKIYIISLAIVPLFSDIAAVSFRVSELLQIVEILYIPALIFIFKERSFGKGVVVSFAVVLFLLQAFYQKILI